MATTIPGYPSHGYNSLNLDESRIIKYYHLDYDPDPVAEFIRSEKVISQDMRNFIADVLTGKIKRKKASTIRRDIEIWDEIGNWTSLGCTLRASKECEGAAYLIAEAFGLPEETVISAYTRVQDMMDKDGFVHHPDGCFLQFKQ